VGFGLVGLGFHRRQPRYTRRREKFSGIRDDTKKIGEETTEDGFTYFIRADGSRYPKNTTIIVTQATHRFYALLREIGQYHNYDELFLDIARQILRIRKVRMTMSRWERRYLVLGKANMKKLKH